MMQGDMNNQQNNPANRKKAMNRVLAYIIALMIMIPSLSCSYNPHQIEQDIHDLINQERAQFNLPPLINLKELDELARYHSLNMLEHDFFSHQDYRGRDVADRMDEQFPMILYSSIGENIAKQTGYYDPNVAQTFVQCWMNSPGHRANILSEDYTHAGVGITFEDNIIYVTQNFAKPIVKLLSNIPQKLSQDKTLTLRLEYLYDIRPEAFSAYLVYPNPEQEFFLNEQTFVRGFEPVQVEWIDRQSFRVTLSFSAGSGIYRLSFGDSTSFSQNGFLIHVQQPETADQTISLVLISLRRSET